MVPSKIYLTSYMLNDAMHGESMGSWNLIVVGSVLYTTKIDPGCVLGVIMFFFLKVIHPFFEVCVSVND